MKIVLVKFLFGGKMFPFKFIVVFQYVPLLSDGHGPVAMGRFRGADKWVNHTGNKLMPLSFQKAHSLWGMADLHFLSNNNNVILRAIEHLLDLRHRAGWIID